MWGTRGPAGGGGDSAAVGGPGGNEVDSAAAGVPVVNYPRRRRPGRLMSPHHRDPGVSTVRSEAGVRGVRPLWLRPGPPVRLVLWESKDIRNEIAFVEGVVESTRDARG